VRFPIRTQRPKKIRPPARTSPADRPRTAAAFFFLSFLFFLIGVMGSPRTASAQDMRDGGRVDVDASTTAPESRAPSSQARSSQAQSSQAPSPQALAPIPRWEVMGLVGWRGVQIASPDAAYRSWEHRGVYVGIGAYAWTTHLKTEVEVGGVAPGEFTTYRLIQLSGQSFPVSVRTTHHSSGVPLGGRLIYQFGENAWFHPFAGAGIAVDWTRDRRHTPFQTQSVRRPDGQFDQIIVAEESRQTETLRETRPVLISGFKAYANTRGFLRVDLLWTIGARDQRYTSWRIGFGTDF